MTRVVCKITRLTAAIAVFIACANCTFGIILHPAGEPNLSSWTDRPDSNVVGRWSYNASFVVIGPRWILTTRHQNTSPATVTIDGTVYACQYSSQWTGGQTGNADIRLVRITAIDGNEVSLAHYAEPYDRTDEVDQEIVIGGFGDGRGVSLDTGGTIYGYDWQETTNTTLRFGTNKIEDTEDDLLDGYTSDIINADFDGLPEPGSTLYECTIAGHDSGGAWLIDDGGEWKVAGLSRAVEIPYEQGHAGDPNFFLFEAWFRSRSNPNVRAPDYLDAVRVSSYADWIAETIHVEGDLTGDEWVDFSDYSLLAIHYGRTDCNQANDWCQGTDFEPRDGNVDYKDVAYIATRWLTGYRYSN